MLKIISFPSVEFDHKTHDYTHRYWGHDYNILQILEQGYRLEMMGWGNGIRPGDYLIIANKDNTTRYKVDTIKYYSDPPDMWAAKLSFAPRR
jgi:hypothetical protein